MTRYLVKWETKTAPGLRFCSGAKIIEADDMTAAEAEECVRRLVGAYFRDHGGEEAIRAKVSGDDSGPRAGGYRAEGICWDECY